MGGIDPSSRLSAIYRQDRGYQQLSGYETIKTPTDGERYSSDGVADFATSKAV